MARKLPKRPKRPKGKARNSIRSWQAYEQRLRSWQARVRQIEGDRKRVEAFKRKYSGGSSSLLRRVA